MNTPLRQTNSPHQGACSETAPQLDSPHVQRCRIWPSAEKALSRESLQRQTSNGMSHQDRCCSQVYCRAAWCVLRMLEERVHCCKPVHTCAPNVLRVPTGSAGPVITNGVCKPASDFLPSMGSLKKHNAVHSRGNQGYICDTTNELCAPQYQQAIRYIVFPNPPAEYDCFTCTYIGLFVSVTKISPPLE